MEYITPANNYVVVFTDGEVMGFYQFSYAKNRKYSKKFNLNK